MSTAEDLMDDARSEAAYQEIEREYDDAAAAVARGICRRRHQPFSKTAVSDDGRFYREEWTPHTPGACSLASDIVRSLTLAKHPPQRHMTNPPIVSMQQMAAFTQRVAERYG